MSRDSVRNLIFVAALSLAAPAWAAGPRVSKAVSEAESKTVVIVQFAPGLSAGDMDRILLDAGVTLIDNPDLLAVDRMVEASPAALRTLANIPELVVIYPASYELRAGVPVRGCAATVAMPEVASELYDGNGGWFTALNGGSLTWSINKAPADFPADRLRSIIEKAMAEWAGSAQLSFHYVSGAGGARTLSFEFHRRDHGDAYPFDGQGGVLAHAFYPPPWNTDPIAGDLHFDDEEPWSEGGTPDLYSVVLHEMGHALGLQHSDKLGSVMYPYYRQFDHLQADDIAALRKLYPAPLAQPEPTSSPEPSAPEPELPTTPSAPSTPEAPPAPSTPNVPQAPTVPSTPNVPEFPPAPSIPTVPQFPLPTVLPLTLSVTNPGTVRTPAVDVNGTVLGGSGVVQVTWSTGSYSGRVDGTSTWRAASLPLSVGSNFVTFAAEDSAGTRVLQSITIDRLASAPETTTPPPNNTPPTNTPVSTPAATPTDTVTPSVSISSPSSSTSATSAVSVRVSGTARDNVGVREVTWKSASGSGVATGTTSWSFDLPLQSGDNAIVVRARDDAGNTGWRSLMITRR